MLTPQMLFIISLSFLFVDARGEIRLDEFQHQPGIYYEFKGNIRIIQSYWKIDILIDTENLETMTRQTKYMSDRRVDLEICEDFRNLTQTDCLLTLGDDIRLTQQAEISKILRENEEIKNKLEQRVERHSRPKRNLVAMLELAGTVSLSVKSLYDFIKPEEVKNANQKFAELKAKEKEIMADNSKQMHAI